MTNIELQPLLTVRDVASAYQLSESTVRRLAYEGTLPSVKVRGSVRFRAEDLYDALVGQTIRVEESPE